MACGNCNRCLLGQYYDCPRVRSVGTVNAWDGAHAQFVMMPERHLFRLPERVDLDSGALVEPAATALAAVTRAGVGLGDTVLVQGSGPIGLAAARLVKLSGAGQVIVAGRQDSKLRLARDLGADATVNTTAEPLAEAVARLAAPYPVDRVIEASGSLDLLREALALVRPGGTVSAVAFYDRPLPELAVDRLVFSNASLRGVAGSLGMYPIVLKLMDLRLLDLRSLITARYPLADFARALQTMNAPGTVKVMIEP